MSGLVRMSRDEHRYVSLRAGDMVVISASPIPGNEKAVSGVIDRLYRKGVHVVYHDTMEVHLSLIHIWQQLSARKAQRIPEPQERPRRP